MVSPVSGCYPEKLAAIACCSGKVHAAVEKLAGELGGISRWRRRIHLVYCSRSLCCPTPQVGYRHGRISEYSVETPHFDHRGGNLFVMAAFIAT